MSRPGSSHPSHPAEQLRRSDPQSPSLFCYICYVKPLERDLSFVVVLPSDEIWCNVNQYLLFGFLTQYVSYCQLRCWLLAVTYYRRVPAMTFLSIIRTVKKFERTRLSFFLLNLLILLQLPTRVHARLVVATLHVNSLV